MSENQIYTPEQLETLDRFREEYQRKAALANKGLEALKAGRERALGLEEVPEVADRLKDLKLAVALQVIEAYEAREPLLRFAIENANLERDMRGILDDLGAAIHSQEIRAEEVKTSNARTHQSTLSKKLSKLTEERDAALEALHAAQEAKS